MFYPLNGFFSPSAPDHCRIYDYDFDLLSSWTYNEAIEYIRRIPRPALVSCLSNPDAVMMYGMDGDSIVPEVVFFLFWPISSK